MATDLFSRRVDWRKLTQRQSIIDTKVSVREFDRLAVAVLDESETMVTLRVAFLRDEQRRYFVQGEIGCTLQVTCQRCMQPVSEQILSEFTVYIVTSEQQQQALPKQYDAILVDEADMLNLKQLIEDELLLQLPFASYHEEIAACDASFMYNAPEIDKELQKESRENPFSVLKSLKK